MIIRDFDTAERVLIVAEIGNNHEGNFDVAKELIRKAADCGVGAVKFQTFKAEHLVSRADAARFNRYKSFELSYSQFEQLAQQAHYFGLLFISTPLDLTSAAFLKTIVDAYKIASGDNNFYPLISHVAKTGKPMIVSTGVSDAEQVARTVAYVKQQWEESHVTGQLAVLHCVSSYPVPPEQANLAAIRFLAHEFGCTVGYSDHTVGIEASLIAVALGARIIEKHFTLDKNYSDFHDHQLSADPAEMQQLVQKVRLVSLMLGKDEKKVQPAEETGTLAFRRSIVAGRDLSKGIQITWSDLTWIRPAGGLPPGEEHVLIGKTLNRDVRFGEQLHASDVEGTHD